MRGLPSSAPQALLEHSYSRIGSFICLVNVFLCILAPQFLPLLPDILDKVKEIVKEVLPVTKKLTALEEAEWEEDSEENALE